MTAVDNKIKATSMFYFPLGFPVITHLIMELILDKLLFWFPDCNVSLACVSCDRDVVMQVSVITETLQLSWPGSHGDLRLTDKVPINVGKR